MKPTATTRQHVLAEAGGDLFLNRRVLAIVVPGALVTSVLTRDPATFRDTAGWIAVNLASLALTWLTVELLRAALARPNQPRPVGLWLVVLSGAIIGAVKGITTSLFGYAVGLLSHAMPLAEWWRAIGTTSQGAFVLPAITLGAATIATYRRDYARLMQTYARRLPPTERQGATADVSDQAQLISGFLTEARDKIGAEHGRALTAVIDQLVDEQLRPLTRKLWGSGTAQTDFSARSLLAASIYTNPFPALIVAAGYALSGFAARAQDFPLDINLLHTAVSAVAIVAIMSIAKRIRPRKRPLAGAHFVFTMLVLVVAHVFVIERIGDTNAGIGTWPLLVTLAIWFPTLTLLAGAIVIAVRGAERMRDLFAELIASDASVQASHALSQLRNRELANALHSTVQNRLVAAARRMEDARFSPAVIRQEKRDLSALLDEVARTHLAPDAAHDHDAAAGIFRNGFADVCARWDGFVTINHTIADTLDTLNRTDQTTVLHVVTEAINNAVRHGQATTVTVQITVTANEIVVTVDDDGFGPVARPAGLGTALFASVSNGDWALQPLANGGSRLTVTIQTARQ